MSDRKKNKKAILPLLLRVSIVAIPTYAVAFLTEKMVYVVPTLVISGLISNHFQSNACVLSTCDGIEPSV